MSNESSPVPAAAPSYSAALEDDEPLNIGELIATVFDHRWLIILITALALAIGAFRAFVAEPVYQANALLQVEEQATGIMSLEALDPMGTATASVSAEIVILRSRSVLGQVVDRLRLDQIAEPRYFPVIGRAIARRYSGAGVAEPWFDQAEYAWGGEAIQLDRLDVPDALLGQQLLLTAGRNGEFTVTHNDETWPGRVGKPFEAELPNGGKIGLFISYLKARPGTQFFLTRISRQGAIARLKGQLSVNLRERGSGMLELKLSGANKEPLPRILDEVMNVYVRQNVERRSAEARNTLSFLEMQLPALKEQLDAAEQAYNTYRANAGTIDLDGEMQSLLELMIDIDESIINARSEREEMDKRYRAGYPEFNRIDARIASLQERKAELDQRVNQLPDKQQRLLRLRRDVEVSTQLYTDLLKTAQQLRIAKAGTVGFVRVIDEAVVTGPMGPAKTRIIAIAFVLGVLASLGLIWLLRQLRTKVESAEALERSLHLPVYATVPHSKGEIKLLKQFRRGKQASAVLALVNEHDDAIESLRSLRTSLRFALADAESPVLMITGPSQAVGKSFLSKNLAVLLAQSGEPVVLVDADMRRGRLHRDFVLERANGLSEYLAGEVELDAVLKETPVAGLSVITCGVQPPRPSELLMSPRFEALVDALKERFPRYVVIDSPPVLAVSDAATIGRYAGLSVFVVRAGKHPIQEIEQSVKRLNLAGVKTGGFVLNDLDVVRLRYRYGYSGYHYQYRYK